MDTPNPSSLRVLLRPSSSTATATASSSASATHLTSSSLSSASSTATFTPAPAPAPTTNTLELPFSSAASLSINSSPSSSSSTSASASSQTASSEGGVVVVGFIGRREDDVTQLINRILDANVFGSGNLDKRFPAQSPSTGEEVLGQAAKDWFRRRRISYHHDEEKGILFLQFSSIQCPALERLSESSPGFESVLEDCESGDLQGMLVMFSVCHVIISLQEGSRFDTQILKKLRMLQAAKHALAPFVKSRIIPLFASKYSSSSSSQPTVPGTSSNNSSPSRSVSISGRHTSAISLMSGLGSYASLFPGQCTPVILFVFLDDFSDGLTHGSHVEESSDSLSSNQASGLNGIPRPSLSMKGSSSVIMLARPMSKSEGGLKKKLQSSLEAQIRFLIKKCRTLAGSDVSHSGSRGGGSANSAPLFSLEASRAVALLDRLTNQRGESLDFATGIVDDVINAKASSEMLLLESHNQSANKEDIQSVKEFIHRQSDTLRGRGGLSTNTNSGSAAGVGMVAVAAAAAAASAASGKPFTTPPELPTLENWLLSSQLIVDAVLSARSRSLDENEFSKRKPPRRNAASSKVDGVNSGGTDPREAAVSWLESGKGLNLKFSTAWCRRALPAAKEVYLNNLPACYPTSLHEEQLQKALRAFQSMVKGPAVRSFSKKLEEECTSIWRSGRQLCDAVSLTGKPCMHQRHNVEIGGSLLEAEVKQHSSGFVFLHACACGRSRRLRDDPFDFKAANDTLNFLPECDSPLPALQLPKVSNAGPILPTSWSLIRLGGARYYEPSKGLLQSGFCSSEKFLLKWTILLEKPKKTKTLSAGTAQKGAVIMSEEPKVESSMEEVKKASGAPSSQVEVQNGVKSQRKHSENDNDDKKISFGRGLPHFSMRKPFSEVVAGSVAADSAFPPLQQRKQPAVGSEKGIKRSGARNRSEQQVHATANCEESQKSEDLSSVQESLNGLRTNNYSDSDPFLQIGSNVVPVNMNGGAKIKPSTSVKHAVVYVGFEHECSHGHRFLLTSEHLDRLGYPYSSLEDSNVPSCWESSERKVEEQSNLTKSGGREKASPHLNEMAGTVVNKVRTSNRSKETMAGGNHCWDGTLLKSVEDLEESLQSITLDDGGSAFSLLNRNLPLYMNCPHCRKPRSKKDTQNIKFASTISQLQRIFLVTPPFPVVLATAPVIQFESSCLPPSVPDKDQQSKFNLGCQVILPPESFLTLRLPFVYGVRLEDRSLHPLKCLEHPPELTAWITKGSTLQVMSIGSTLHEGDQL